MCRYSDHCRLSVCLCPRSKKKTTGAIYTKLGRIQCMSVARHALTLRSKVKVTWRSNVLLAASMQRMLVGLCVFCSFYCEDNQSIIPDWAAAHCRQILHGDDRWPWPRVLVQCQHWLCQVPDVKHQHRAILQSGVEVVSIVRVPSTRPHRHGTLVPAQHTCIAHSYRHGTLSITHLCNVLTTACLHVKARLIWIAGYYRLRSTGDNTFGSVHVSICCGHSPVWTI